MHNDHRPTSTTPSMAGGFFIAMLTIAGTVIGGLQGQPTIGLLAGLAIGIVIALALWLFDRAKGRS